MPPSTFASGSALRPLCGRPLGPSLTGRQPIHRLPGRAGRRSAARKRAEMCRPAPLDPADPTSSTGPDRDTPPGSEHRPLAPPSRRDHTRLMELLLLDDPERFATRAAPFLVAERLSATVVATQLDGVRRGLRTLGPEDRWLVVVEGDLVVGAAMHTPPRPPFLPQLAPEVAAFLAARLHELGRAVAGVVGEAGATLAFAEEWVARAGGSHRVAVAERLYRLGSLCRPEGLPGGAGIATHADTGLVERWLGLFHDEATPSNPLAPGELAVVAERMVGSGRCVLWRLGQEAVSLAQVSAAIEGVARIGPVFTPEALRGRGYAAAATAAATTLALEHGATDVVLYTDLANPTSNALYQRLGYRPYQDAAQRIFVA